MARTKTTVTITVPANNGYYGLSSGSRDISINNEKEPDSQKALAKLISGEHSSFFVDSEEDFNNDGYHNVHTISFRKFNDFSEPRLVYDVRKTNGSYYLNTGLYIGFLNVDGVRIEINTGYPECFLKRMLNVANNIFFDSSLQMNLKEKQMKSILSVILEYLFLLSFKASFSMGLPSHYKRFDEKGLNVRGNLDTKKYLTEDMLMDYQVSYSYKQRVFSQDIIDILYLAMRSLESTKETCSLLAGDLSRYYRQLKQLYSGKVVSRSTIRRIEKNSSLNNPMYSRYKKVLRYARYILEYKDLIYEDGSDKTEAPGFLLDISELWEIYLAKIISNRFPNYSVSCQTELPLYNGTFFSRANYPDIVMESKDSIVVLDAKYKKMNFQNSDVDRNDLHQIHSYAGFFRTEAKKNVKLCSLVYPTADDETVEMKNMDDSLYGIPNASTRFSIGYIKVGKTYSEMVENEKAFLDRLAEYI